MKGNILSLSRNFFYQRQKFLIILFFTLTAFLIYGHFVFRGIFTQGGDFGAAVSYVLNFKEAIQNGQWIPRWVIIAREVTLGSGGIDGTAITPDSPVFQYYAFLQSALAYPLVVIGFSAITALQLIVIAAFICSGCVLYKTGRLLGASRIVSFLSGYSYLMSPWLISNYYGRGGIAEALGQSALPLILLSYAFAFKQKYLHAMLSIAIGTIILALSHNIFLFYGMVLCGLLVSSHVIFSSLLAVLKQKKSLYLETRTNIKFLSTYIAGVIIGLAATSWQWLPAFMTIKEISFSYIGNLKGIVTSVADLSGAWGFPKQFVESWSGTKREFFFTIGWWTIPAILGLVFAPAKNRSVSFAILLSFVIFFMFTFWPNSIIPYFPLFSVAQFTSRFLAFLSVLGSFALCIAFPYIPRYIAAGIFILIAISQFPVLFFDIPLQKFPEEQYLRGYEYNGFYANSPYETHIRNWYDGWMEYDNRLDLNTFSQHPVYLKINGKTKDNQKIKIFIAKIDAPKIPVTNTLILQGNFNTIFKINNPTNGLRFYIPGAKAVGEEPIPIRPERIELITDPISAYIPATEVEKIFSYGYKRIFKIKENKINSHVINQGLYTIELPIIYNRFVVPFQNGKELTHQVDFNHRLQVETRDLQTPIIVQYSLPWLVWLISLNGIFIFCVLVYRQFYSKK